MSIWEDVRNHPGTIPFHGFPLNIEIGIDPTQEDENPKDLVLKINIPEGYDDVDELADKACKYFDGEVIQQEPKLVIIRADVKMLGYTLAFALRDNYHEIKSNG